jgi:hypothetical protein
MLFLVLNSTACFVCFRENMAQEKTNCVGLIWTRRFCFASVLVCRSLYIHKPVGSGRLQEAVRRLDSYCLVQNEPSAWK